MKLLAGHEKNYMLENPVSNASFKEGVFTERLSDGERSIIVEATTGDRRKAYSYLIRPDDMQFKNKRTIVWWG
jgi:hypothetical protein